MGWIHNIDGTVTDERTGQTFINASVGAALGYGGGAAAAQAAAQNEGIPIPVSESSPGGTDYRDRDIYGNLTTNQTGSQYWMNAGYTGEEPDLATKTIFSSADYARDYAQSLAAGFVRQYGDLVSPNIELVAEYPTSAPVPTTDDDLASAMQQRLANLGTGVLDFVQKNLLIVVVILTAIFVVPSILRSARGYRR